MKPFFFIFMCAFFASACSPNQSILQSNIDNTTPTPAATETPAPLKKITVGELMNRTASAPADSFTFPCTLHVYKDEDRDKLRKLRDLWLSKEKDSHYVLAPSKDCVCPGICVLRVENATMPAPNNWGLIVIERSLESYFWIARNSDLSNADLIWASSTPELKYHNPDGSKSQKGCWIELDKRLNQYVTNCWDEQLKKLPSLK
jgi:hypothetical protein